MRPALLVVALPLLIARPLMAQWAVRQAPAVELWFHAMALTGTQGFGALPLYDPGYPAAIRADRDRRALAPSALEHQAPAFRSAFEADSAFEMMHFLPLTAATATPDALLAEVAPRIGLALLRTPAERDLFTRFVAAVRSEWTVAWRDERQQRSDSLAAALKAIETQWAAIATAIGPYLTRYRLTSGIIVPVRGLGPDGRLVPATGESAALVAVQWPRDPARAGDAAFFAARELCYPAVREALRLSGPQPSDRRDAERRSGLAAVRCGALLMEATNPSLAARYRAAFGAESAADFEARFPIPNGLASALAQATVVPR